MEDEPSSATRSKPACLLSRLSLHLHAENTVRTRRKSWRPGCFSYLLIWVSNGQGNIE